MRMLLIFLLLPASLGCISHQVDFGTTFKVWGVVSNPEGDGVCCVAVYFLDVSMDQNAKNQKRRFKIGESDSEGRIDAEFFYWWGHSVADINKSKWFNLVFVKDGIQLTKEYKLENQKCMEGECRVEFQMTLDG